MKNKHSIIILALCAITLFSCNKENDIYTQDENDATLKSTTTNQDIENIKQLKEYQEYISSLISTTKMIKEKIDSLDEDNRKIVLNNINFEANTTINLLHIKEDQFKDLIQKHKKFISTVQFKNLTHDKQKAFFDNIQLSTPYVKRIKRLKTAEEFINCVTDAKGEYYADLNDIQAEFAAELTTGLYLAECPLAGATVAILAYLNLHKNENDALSDYMSAINDCDKMY